MTNCSDCSWTSLCSFSASDVFTKTFFVYVFLTLYPQAFNAFVTYLDYIPDRVSAQRRDPERFALWERIINDFKLACHNWYQNLTELPTKTDI